jgi:hypothetical protein
MLFANPTSPYPSPHEERGKVKYWVIYFTQDFTISFPYEGKDRLGSGERPYQRRKGWGRYNQILLEYEILLIH